MSHAMRSDLLGRELYHSTAEWAGGNDHARYREIRVLDNALPAQTPTKDMSPSRDRRFHILHLASISYISCKVVPNGSSWRQMVIRTLLGLFHENWAGGSF